MNFFIIKHYIERMEEGSLQGRYSDKLALHYFDEECP
jgi:hypothetical protein